MRFYETLYIINPNLADEDVQDVVAKFNGVVEKNDGVLVKVEEWGKRTLAYAVKKFDKGNYVLMQYCGESGITYELKRDLGLDDRVLKYQTIKLSDDADPEALKAKVDESEPHVEEEVQTEEEKGTEGETKHGV